MVLNEDMPASASRNTGTAGERTVAMTAAASIVEFALSSDGHWQETGGLVETPAVIVKGYQHQAMVRLVAPPAPYEVGEVLVLDNERLVLV
jgi:hypothetical protein